MNTESRKSEEEITVEKFHWSDLYKKEDWLAVWIGFAVILVAAIAVLLGQKGQDGKLIPAFNFNALNFSKWGPGASASLGSQLVKSSFWFALLRTFAVTSILFTLGAKLKGQNLKKFIPAYIALFALAVVVRLISAEFTLNRYLEWAFFALIVGLLISNTVGTPDWLKNAVQTEYYIKAGLVIMGFSVLFSNIVKFGPYGLTIAWFVTPVVIIFMWFFGTRVLKLSNKSFVITIATATSVCGTSAAIAVGAASKAKKTDLSLAVSISIIFTVLMMVFEPLILKGLGVSQLIGGALIGGTVDSTGAVAVAGTALGEDAQKSAVHVKTIQNILIGFIAFFVAVFFAKYVDGGAGRTQKVGASEIWYRLPKFILGFFAASLIASFIIKPVAGSVAVSSINKILDQYKNWAFVLAFVSIGLDTNFKEIAKQMKGGSPLVLYVVGQLFNIVLTFAVVWFVLSGKFFPVPVLN